MINNLKSNGADGTLLSYEKDGYVKSIPFEIISSIWHELDEESFSIGRAYVWERYIAFSVLVAGGQGGVFFVWDTESEEMIHYSECSYFIDAIFAEKDIIFLYEISNYVTPYHLEVRVTLFGTKDINDSGQRVYCEQPTEYHASTPEDLKFRLTDNVLEILDEDGPHLYSSNVSQLRNQKPNEDFGDLYKDYGYGMDPRKLVMQSMIT